MKRLLFIVISVFQLNQSMETLISPQQEWREQFNNLDKKQYNDCVDYDLDLRLWQDNRENIVHNNLSLLAHGFLASPTTMTEYARLEGSHSIPGDKVTFKFKDAFNGNLSFITYSSFGQGEDIKSLLVAVKAVYDSCWVKDKIGCNLFGQSRGAGAVVNMLAVLNTKCDEWGADFCDIKKLFNEQTRREMILMIQKGVVVLDTPMVTTQMGVKTLTNSILQTLSYKAEQITNCIYNYCTFFIVPEDFSSLDIQDVTFSAGESKLSFLQNLFGEEWKSNFIHDYVLPIISNYSPSGAQALTSVANMPKDLKILVSFQSGDEFVGNDIDREFSEQLSSHIGEDNVWVVLGNDKGKQFDDETWQLLETADKEEKLQKRWFVGGLPYRKFLAHAAGFVSLLQRGVLNAFFKQHKCSYDQDCIKLNRGTEILKKSYCVKNFEEYFKNYDINDDSGRSNSSI